MVKNITQKEQKNGANQVPCSGEEAIAFCLELAQLVQELLQRRQQSATTRNKSTSRTKKKKTHLDFVGLQSPPPRLLSETRLEALKHFIDEVFIVDAEELCELRGSPAAGLEHLLFGRRRRDDRRYAELGSERRHGRAGRQGPTAFGLGGRWGRGRGGVLPGEGLERHVGLAVDDAVEVLQRLFVILD